MSEISHAVIAEVLNRHTPTTDLYKRLIRCACGLEIHFIDARAWHRHAAAMVAAVLRPTSDAGPPAKASELVEFFRGEEEEWGLKGDYEDWSPERSAMELIRQLRAERLLLAKLASPKPEFFNPLHVLAAKALRDCVLRKAGLL